MSAKDNLLHKINSVYSTHDAGFTAQDCEALMAVSRSVISHYLNRLCDEGKLTKQNTRPVRFYLADEVASGVSAGGVMHDDPFNLFIGADGSLQPQVALCRAAVNYPSEGLALLMVGESGVGKSYLAHLIHQYAVEKSLIAAGKTLVDLNCADYANNPELLSGALFGYTRGAFTGADREKAGLLDHADGGFLFLDEVHRLSAENQEKLFLFMDKGYFYRLGDSSTRRYAKVRFLFATSEATDEMLLTTFRRRIPCRVELPAFSERPVAERVALIEAFLQQESGRLKREIEVEVALMQQLIATPVRGNVGELKNQIKVLCAGAWSQQKESEQSNLVLALSASNRPTPSAERLLITPHGQPGSVSLLGQRLGGWLNEERLLVEFCQSANAPLFARKLEEWLHYSQSDVLLDRSRHGYLWKKSQQAFSQLADLTGIEINPALRNTLWLCMLYALHAPVAEQPLAELDAASAWTSQRALMVADECLALIRAQVTPQPLPLLRPVIRTLFHHHVEPDQLIQGVIVSHGNATASSIAGTANKLVGGYYLKAFDMPFSVDTRGIIEMLIRHLDSIQHGSGLIILVDMGSLNEIYREIKLHLHSDLLVMNNVSTSMALDIAGKIQHRLSMPEIVDSIKGAYEVEARYYEGMIKGNKIVISCISGAGVSAKLKDILMRYLDEKSMEIVTVEYDDLKWKLSRADTVLNGTQLIITTTDIDAGTIPLVNVQQLLKEKSTRLWQNYFCSLLTPEQMESMIDDIVKLFTLEGVAGHLKFLNPAVIIEEVDLLIKQYEAHYRVHFESYLRMNLFMHIAAMIERLMINDAFHHRDNHELSQPQLHFMDLQRELFKPLENRYRIALSTSESLMIYELIEPWVTV